MFGSECFHVSHRLFHTEFPSLLSQVKIPLGEAEQLKQNTAKTICSNKSQSISLSNKIVQKTFLKNTHTNAFYLGCHFQFTCLKSLFRHHNTAEIQLLGCTCSLVSLSILRISHSWQGWKDSHFAWPQCSLKNGEPMGS